MTGAAELSQTSQPTADDISAHQLKYTYNADGNLSKIIYPTVQDGVKSLSYQYNKDGWLTEIKAETISGDDTAEKTVRTYAYDTYGKVREIKDSRNLFGTNDKAVKKTYSYDSFDRVTAMVYTDLETGKEMESYRYEYDKNSNITKKTEINNYPKEDGKKVNESKEYTYDANGNKIKVKNTKTGEIEEKVYDAENRLSEVSVTKDNKTSVVQQNIYNGDGQRIQKTEGNQTTNYYYQDGVVSYTTDETGKQTGQNLIGTEGNIIGTQRYSGDNVSYYLYNKDIQGSTTSLVKEDGSADVVYQYTDFGENTVTGENAAGNEVCYTGGIYDSTTGLYYLNARYFHPEDGRFLTEDTYRGEVNEPDTWHLYAYCKNNPVNYKDPSGHVAIPAGYYIALNVPGFGQVLLGATAVVVGGYAVYKGGSWIYKKIKKIVKKKKLKGRSIRYSKSKTKSGTKRKNPSKAGKKEKSTNEPEWAKYRKQRKGEDRKQFAKRILDEKYGKGKWPKGARSEYSRIVKYHRK